MCVGGKLRTLIATVDQRALAATRPVRVRQLQVHGYFQVAPAEGASEMGAVVSRREGGGELSGGSGAE